MHMNIRFWNAGAAAALSLVVAASFAGCKAKEAPTSGFLENPNLMTRDETTPFQRTYWNSKYEKSVYTEVYVAPVNTNYILSENLWEKASAVNVTREQIQENVAAMAAYTRESFIRAITEDPNHRFKVVDKPGPKTLILEVALTQLVPSRAVLNAIGYVTWIPAAVSIGSSTVTGSQDTGKGIVAIEGRVRDGASGEIIGMFADCEFPKSAILDIKALNWWAPAKAIIDDWSRQLVELANRRPGSVVKDTPTFELLVW
jgi:hypothetical protein